MSAISGTGSASSAWSDMGSARADMKNRMFGKVDSNGSGSVDKTELQGLFDKIAQKTGATALSADDLFGKMDTDGNGSISQDELDAGMKSLMPKPGSTLDFAQRSGASMGPPPGAEAAQVAPGGTSSSDAASSGSSSSSTSTDPLDTNGDGVVSAQERAAGDLKTLLNDLFKAIGSMETDGARSSASAVSLIA